MLKRLAVAIAMIAASTAVGVAQDAEKGKTVFNQCMICHSIGPGAQNKIGPELNGIDGRKAGTVANFSYSDANKNSGIVWNEASFKDYIKDPRARNRYRLGASTSDVPAGDATRGAMRATF